MQPGRELDELVAEKILGWRFSKSTFEQYEPSCWYDKATSKRVWGRDFSPSTDIAAAWKVVEKLNDLGMDVEINQNAESTPGDHERCHVYIREFDTINEKELHEDVWASTAPHAICLAALKVTAQSEAAVEREGS